MIARRMRARGVGHADATICDVHSRVHWDAAVDARLYAKGALLVMGGRCEAGDAHAHTHTHRAAVGG